MIAPPRLHKLPRPALAAVALFVCSLAGTAAHAGLVQVNFSGGNGDFLWIGLPQPISYTVTNDTPTDGVVIVLQAVGNVFNGSSASLEPLLFDPMLQYTANAQTWRLDAAANYFGNAITFDDLLLFTSNNNTLAPGVDLNDVVLVDAGKMRTTFNYAGAPPASGLYSTILVDGSGVQLATGSAVPEPAALALLGIGSAALLTRQRRKDKDGLATDGALMDTDEESTKSDCV